MLRCEIYIKPTFYQADQYKPAYWKHWLLYLNVQLTVKFDSQCFYSGPVFLKFKISFSLTNVYSLMKIINMPIGNHEV